MGILHVTARTKSYEADICSDYERVKTIIRCEREFVFLVSKRLSDREERPQEANVTTFLFEGYLSFHQC